MSIEVGVMLGCGKPHGGQRKHVCESWSMTKPSDGSASQQRAGPGHAARA